MVHGIRIDRNEITNMRALHGSITLGWVDVSNKSLIYFYFICNLVIFTKSDKLVYKCVLLYLAASHFHHPLLDLNKKSLLNNLLEFGSRK